MSEGFSERDIELIRLYLDGTESVSQESVQDERLFRAIFFADDSSMEDLARCLLASPCLSRRLNELQRGCDQLSIQPISELVASSDDSVVGYVCSAIEEATLMASRTKDISNARWHWVSASKAELDAMRTSAIRLISHSMRAWMSGIYVSSFRGAAVASLAESIEGLSSIQIEPTDVHARIGSDGVLQFTCSLRSNRPLSDSCNVGLHLIDPSGGSLLLAEAPYASVQWKIVVEGFGDAARLETEIVPSSLFAVCPAGCTPFAEQWRIYVYDTTLGYPEAENPSDELLIEDQPVVSDGKLSFVAEFPDGFLEVHEDLKLRLNIRVGWRKQALAEWPVSSLGDRRYNFSVPFPYVDHLAVPFGSLFFFEIC